MTSTNVKKYSYINESNTPISLIEYYIEEDLDNKYLIFNFQNNFNQVLKQMEISIEAYDSSNKLVERLSFRYSCNVLPNQVFMPHNKLKVLKECESIKFKIIKAEYENSRYINGEFKEINFKVELAQDVNEVETIKDVNQNKTNTEVIHISKVKNAQSKHEKKLEKTKNKAEQHYYKYEKKAYGKQRFKVDSLLKKPFSAFKIIFISLIFVGIVAALIWSCTYFTSNYGEFVKIDDVTYQVLSDKAYVYEGNKKETNVCIESSIVYEDTLYEVVGIKKNAFKKAKIESLTLNRNVSIGDAAFEGSNLAYIYNPEYINKIGENAFKSTKLSTIELVNVKTIKQGAFSNISSLNTVYAPNALVESKAFKGSNNINTITINSTKSYLFSDIFDSSNYSTINTVVLGQSIDENYSFKGIKYIYYLYINSSSKYIKEDNIAFINYK